nr:50S ribosomal protein L17 [Candidatus Dadabacteria bacterium]NIS07193.1 50S ribosomal protein L17 [Candidatus Dadabacteria bacterium]NIY20861.1 50S ribosomal protein L17 [Candidatus Dadabacteria bacterium]
MRHKRVGRKLGVTTKHRRAMFRNMVTDLFRHERIKTTDTRAKELRRVAEKYITIAKKGTLHARRIAATFVKDKEVLQKLFDELATRFKDRPGGYTRIVKLGVRAGDNAPISLIKLIEEEYKPKKKRPRRAKKKKAQTAAAEPEAKSTKKESAEELGLGETDEKTEEVVETKTESTEAVPTETAPQPEAK